MKDVWDDGLLPRILLIGIFIALLGISPLSKTVTAGFEAARRAHEGSQPAQVAANLAAVAEQQPWRADLWQPAGFAALEAGDPQNAAIYFARAATQRSLSPQGYLAWGAAEWQMENAETALQIWRIAEKMGVSPAETLPLQAEVFRFTGDDDALIENLKAQLELLDRRPQTANRGQLSAVGGLAYELGLLLAAHNPAAAPAYLLRAADLDPSLAAQTRALNFAIQRELSKNDPAYLLVIAGRELANLGDWDLAETAFKNAVELHPEYAEAWAYLGEARQHTVSEADPLAALEVALNLDPQSLAANTFVSLYWQRQGQPETALAYLQNAAELDPTNPDLMVEIGNLTAILGDLETGQVYYEQAIALRRNDPRYLREFLNFSLRYNLNLQEVALPLARQLVIYNPTDAASLDVMGEVLLRLGDLLNAERFFLRALAQNPDYDQAHLHLGGLYRIQGDADLARYHYNRVLELTSNAQTYARAQESLDAIYP
ncbi:MAG TPA: hypothetical protein DEH22_15075 [Chloroflexi bacterium]|nr:hypothetical protein [Chloroflexota bacterium]